MVRANPAEGEWLELVADLLLRPPAALPDETIALRLCDTFELTGCSYTEGVGDTWSALRLWPATQLFDGRRAEVERWTRDHAFDRHPILRFYMRTGVVVPIATADVPAEVVGRDVLDEWDDLGSSIQASQQIALPLAIGASAHRSFVLGRSAPFAPADVRLAELLWRLLTGVDRLVTALARRPAAGDVAADLRLTSREVAVLALLAEGLTAAAIARRLAIAERTVHKHLGNSYVKLRVGDRLSAVLRVRQLGLLPATGQRRESSRYCSRSCAASSTSLCPHSAAR